MFFSPSPSHVWQFPLKSGHPIRLAADRHHDRKFRGQKFWWWCERRQTQHPIPRACNCIPRYIRLKYATITLLTLSTTHSIIRTLSNMGLLGYIAEPLSRLLGTDSPGILLAATVFTFIVVAILLNVLSQLIFRNPNEPPLVFHWVPFFGSTIEYGIDPYKFFFRCKEKVGSMRARVETRMMG